MKKYIAVAMVAVVGAALDSALPGPGGDNTSPSAKSVKAPSGRGPARADSQVQFAVAAPTARRPVRTCERHVATRLDRHVQRAVPAEREALLVTATLGTTSDGTAADGTATMRDCPARRRVWSRPSTPPATSWIGRSTWLYLARRCRR